MLQVAGGTIVILDWTNCGANCVSAWPFVYHIRFSTKENPLLYFSSSLTPAWARRVNSLAPVFSLTFHPEIKFFENPLCHHPSHFRPETLSDSSMSVEGSLNIFVWHCRLSMLHNLCPFVVFRPLNLITLFFFFSVFPFHWKWVIH